MNRKVDRDQGDVLAAEWDSSKGDVTTLEDGMMLDLSTNQSAS